MIGEAQSVNKEAQNDRPKGLQSTIVVQILFIGRIVESRR